MQDGNNAAPKFKSFAGNSGQQVNQRLTASEQTIKRADAPRTSREYRATPQANGSRVARYESTHTAIDTTSAGQSLRIFEVDRLGDEKNVLYGSLHQYAVPTYRRFNRHSLLGIPRRHTYEVLSSGSVQSIVVNAQDVSHKAPLSQKRLTSLTDGSQELIVRSSSHEEPQMEEDFLSLEESKSNETIGFSVDGHCNEDSFPSSDLEAQSFGQSKHHSGQDSRVGLQSPIESTQLCMQRDTNVAGNKDLDLNSLAAEDMYSTGTSASAEQTIMDRKSLAEIKISVCEKALRGQTDEKEVEDLTSRLMEAGRLAWDDKKLRRKWESLRGSSTPRLRLQYAEYLRTASLGFQFDQTRQAYVDCIRYCDATGFYTGTSADLVVTPNSTILLAILSSTSFLLEAGHTELAVSAWQSLLGYTFNIFSGIRSLQPPSNDDTFQRLGTFECFWESETPRIGEIDGQDNGICGTSEDISERETDFYSRWASLERVQSAQYFLPARITEDPENDDPFRVVLFSDIKPYLVAFNSGPVSSHAIVNAYIQFFGLPALPGCRLSDVELGTSNTHANDRLLSWTKCDRTGPLAVSVNSMTIDQHTMFGSSDWPSPLQCLQSSIVPFATTQFLLRSLKTLVNAGFGGDELAEYLLSIELRISPETVRGTAKNFIKCLPSSLRLYNALALVEYRHGETRKGQSIIVKALKMGKQMGAEAQAQSILLWRTLIWESLTQGRQREAAEQVSWFGREQDMPSEIQHDKLSETARTRQKLHTEKVSIRYAMDRFRKLTAQRLRDHCDYLFQRNRSQLAAIAVECLILYTYVTNESDLKCALTVFREFRQVLQQVDIVAIEMLSQSCAYLIYIHMKTTQIIKLADIREIAQELIDAFPLNTIFLSLYAWNESRLRVDDRLHSRVNNMVYRLERKVGESVVLSSFLADVEIKRFEGGIATAFSVRNTFERALIKPICAHSARLWRSYIAFEVDQKDPRRLLEVCMRAIQACPWVKEFFLLAFEHCSGPDGVVERDLQALQALFEERGLRIHQAFNR